MLQSVSQSVSLPYLVLDDQIPLLVLVLYGGGVLRQGRVLVLPVSAPAAHHGVGLDVEDSLVGEDQDLSVPDDVLVHDVHIPGQPPLVHLAHHLGPDGLLLVVIPHHAVRMDVPGLPGSQVWWG